MTIHKIISFFEKNGFQHIPAKMREFKKIKEMSDHHKIKRFLLKMIHHSCFMLPHEYQHIKSDNVYILPTEIINEKLQQYMNMTLNYSNIWVDCCMILFHSDDSNDIGQYYDGFMLYSSFVEQNFELSISD